MDIRRPQHLKNFLGITALVLSFAALQSPLWRPDAGTLRVTATAGGTAILTYDRAIEKVSIFEKRTASLSAAGPGKLIIHGHAPGKTSLLIRYKDGGSRVYDVVILPG